MLKRIYLFAALMLPLGSQAASWTEDCPQMEIGSPFQYKRIWTPDDAWVKKPMAANQALLMSCGNWKVMGQEMVCYYGGYKVTYDYSVKKDIPAGVTCERGDQCQFKCSSSKAPQKFAPKINAPRQIVPQ